MSLYVPLDVEYASDEEFIEAGPYAELLYIRGICFAKRKMTDGRISTRQLAAVAIGIPHPTKQAAALVDVGLWRAVKDGWTMPAYLKRNPSKADITASKEIASEAGMRGNHERWHVGPDGKANPKCPLCRQDRIGSPDKHPIGLPESGGNRVGSPIPETEPIPEPIPETETEPIPKELHGCTDTPLQQTVPPPVDNPPRNGTHTDPHPIAATLADLTRHRGIKNQ